MVNSPVRRSYVRRSQLNERMKQCDCILSPPRASFYLGDDVNTDDEVSDVDSGLDSYNSGAHNIG